MDKLRTEIRTYSVEREVPCVVCGRFFGQTVAVVLFDGPEQRGDLCPCCLAEGPAGAAAAARGHADRLRSRGEQWWEDAARPVAWAARARERAAQMLARAAELLALADRLRQGERWPVCLPEVREAGRDGLQTAASKVREEDLHRVMDDRYLEVLPQTA